MKVDLHIHSTASDGSWDAGQLVREVKKNAIQIFSVTDHDTVGAVETISTLAKNLGVCYIPGVEISATLRGKSFHILGYGINSAYPALIRLLARNTALLEEVDHTSIKKLIADGVAIDYEDYCAYQHDPVRGGWKALSFLIDKGVCRDVNDFFTNVFTKERGLTFPEFPSPSEIIEVIYAAGGVPVLAHPGSQFHGTSIEETLDMFGRAEIGGIECFHPNHDVATTTRAIGWCNKHNLLITGGSDCHGTFVPKRKLGTPDIRLEQLRLGRLIETCEYSS